MKKPRKRRQKSAAQEWLDGFKDEKRLIEFLKAHFQIASDESLPMRDRIHAAEFLIELALGRPASDINISPA